jgi:hypothetical protein
VLATTTEAAWRRVALGTTLALVPIATYPFVVSNIQLTSAVSVSTVEDLGYLTLTMSLLGSLLALNGVNKFLITRTTFLTQYSSLRSIFATIRLVLSDRSSARVRFVAMTMYGVFFAFVSGIVVYQPNLNFSTLYIVKVPSSIIVPCCGAFGQVPQLVVYLTGHLGFLVTPASMILLFVVSWLVGINLAVLAETFRVRRTNRQAGLVSAMGGVLGTLTACPACAGAFLTTVIGETGAVSLASLAAYQGLLIAVSIPLLVLAPILTAKRASTGSVTTCP